MLQRPTSRTLPRQRLSPAAMAATGALHVALVWLLLQHTPLQQVVRYVVYQTVRPASPPPASTSASSSAPASRAITPGAGRGSAADDLPLFSNRPESSMPLETTLQLPDSLRPARPKARRTRRAESREQAAAPRPALRSDTRLTLPAPVPEPAPAPLPEPSPSVQPEPVPVVPAPVPLPAPVPVPVPAPEAVPVPAPQPAPAPVPPAPLLAPPAPAPVPAPVPAEPAPAPAPAPVPVPQPAVAPQAVPAPAPPAPAAVAAPPVPAAPAAPQPAPAVPSAAPQRLQGPIVDVPVPPGAPGSGSAVTVPVLPAPGPGPGWGAPGVAPARPPAAALPPAPVILPPRVMPTLPGPYATPRRSLADMANEQLRRGTRKDPLAEGMEGAAQEECLRAPERPGAAGGLLAAPELAARALSGRCPR